MVQGIPPERQLSIGKSVDRVIAEAQPSGLRRLEAFPLRLLDQGSKGLRGNSERPTGKAIDISRVHSDDFALRVEYRASAGPVRRGRVVNQLVPDHVAQMPACRRRANQR